VKNDKGDNGRCEQAAKASPLGDAYEPAVRGAAKHLGVHFDDAREAVHEVALRVLEAQAKRKRKKRLGNPKAYLTKSAIGAYERSRGENHRVILFSELSPDEKVKLFEETPGPGPDPARVAEQNELAALAWADLAKLPPRQRQVLAMRSSGLAFGEIGRILGISPGSARAHYHVGLQALRGRFRHAA
jgi:RNA polymerase sigma factor (sigma-70 family)